MLLSRLTFYSLLAACCTARLQTSHDFDKAHRAVSSTLADRLCWNDGTECDPETTCFNCCTGSWSTDAGTNAFACGFGVCLEDGIVCSNSTDYICYRCCNGAYEDGGKTCGGQCRESGTACNIEPDYTCGLCCNYTYFINDDKEYQCGCKEDGTSCIPGDTCYSCCNGAFDDDGKKCGGQCRESGTSCTLREDFDKPGTCDLCCNYTYFKTPDSDDSYQCGCIEDGQSCIPGESCYHCCNGAYNDGGLTCGGTCIADGKECTQGEDCHLCCSFSTYWFSTGKMQCGTEDCYEDGASCIPGQNCHNCCSGGAYDGDGTICGGSCLPAGAECTYFGTCGKCCTENNLDSFGSSLYQIGDNFHWNATKGSMVCGYELCWEDGTDCISGYTCQNCCTGYSGDSDGKCGGLCLKSGTKCNYYSTCAECCNTNMYNATLGYHVCADYDESDYATDDDGSSASPSMSPADTTGSLVSFLTNYDNGN